LSTDVGIIFEAKMRVFAPKFISWELYLPSKEQGIFSILAEKIYPNGCCTLESTSN